MSPELFSERGSAGLWEILPAMLGSIDFFSVFRYAHFTKFLIGKGCELYVGYFRAFE